MASSPPRLVGPAVAAGATALLLARLAPDVQRKPVFEDEALAGLVSAHGLHDVLGTALLDRGGAPIHFVLAHVALALDPSFEALRWLSVVFALATVPLSYDLGRRLRGTVAGATAAVLVASSGLLGIYGSFGRMYALYAFAATLSVDLFVRACVLRTTRATVAAAAAAWLLPAVHPFGAFMLLAEGVVAVAIWRREPVRIGLAVTAIALATVPFVIADLRLADRFSAGVSGRSGLVTPGEAVRVQARAFGSFAGGREPLFVVFGALALLGLVILLRDRPALGAFFLLSLVAPLVVLVLGRTSADLSGHLDARQLIADLPIWIALVAVGTERVLRGLRPQLQVALFAALTAAALLAPTAVPDPRTAQSGRPRALAAPAAWLRRSVRPGDVLFPSSPVFLAALPETGAARSLPREQGSLVVRAVRRASLPVQSIFVAVPLENEPVDTTRLHALPFESHLFEHWLLVRAAGPFSTRPETLTATYRALAAAQTVVEGRTPRLRGYFRQSLAALCAALHSLGSRCPAPQPGRDPVVSRSRADTALAHLSARRPSREVFARRLRARPMVDPTMEAAGIGTRERFPPACGSSLRRGHAGQPTVLERPRAAVDLDERLRAFCLRSCSRF